MAISPPATSGTSGSNYNPPDTDKSSKYFNVWMPVPLQLSGVVIVFDFPRSKSGIFDLILEKISHSQTPP